MKIIQLTSENIKALKAVEITPEGNMVVISGKNGAGKSSVLDSIFWALTGARNVQEKPIREGETEARIRLDLGEIVVTRRFNAAGTQLVVTSAEGAQFPSPQKMLDELVGAIAFDPLEFTRMPAKAQVKALCDVMQIKVDFDSIERDNKTDYDKRTVINRQAKELAAQVALIEEEVKDFTGEKLSVADMVAKYSAAQGRAAEAKTRSKDIEALAAEIQESIARATQLEAKLEKERARTLKLTKELERNKTELAAINVPSEVRLQRMQELISDAGAHNEKVARRESLEEKRKELSLLIDKANGYTERINQRNKSVRETVAAAKSPLEGLGFGQNGVTFEGIPFEQVNSATQLKVSVAIAVASNPELRIARIENGSLLDADGMQALREMADENDFQFWVERVGEEELSIVIEDGSVKGASNE